MPEGEKIGGAGSKVWAESAPLVEIGLTNLPDILVVVPHPRTPQVPASLTRTWTKSSGS